MKITTTLFFYICSVFGTTYSQENFPAAIGIVYDDLDLRGYGNAVNPGGDFLGATDDVIDFNYGTGGLGNPFLGTGDLIRDNFSIRWNAIAVGKSTELYTLRVISDDGVRLYFDGQLVIDDWGGIGRRQNTAQVPVVQGKEFPVTLEYQENTDIAEVHLFWSSPTVPTELIEFIFSEGDFTTTVPATAAGFPGVPDVLFEDPDDIANSSSNIIDIRDIRVASFDDSLSFVYRLDFIPSTVIEDPSNGYNLFIDTDSLSNTGFDVFSIGAEFVIQGRQLFQYTGNGTNWSWTPVAFTWFEKGNNSTSTFMQHVVRRSWLGNPSSFRMVFFGDNAAERGGNTTDVVPDNAGQGGYLEFFDGPTGLTFDGELDDYAAYSSNFPRDPVDQPESSAIDFRQLLVANSPVQYNLGYWNQNPASPGLGDSYLMFVDTNRNLNTGYQVFGRRAEYMIRGARVFRYTGGTSGVWSWEFIGDAEIRNGGNTAELRFPRAWFGNQTAGTRIEFKFFGVNQGAASDAYPDGSDWLEYRLQ